MKLFKAIAAAIGVGISPRKEETEIKEKLERVFGPEKVDDLFEVCKKMSRKTDLTASEAADKIIQAAKGFEQIRESVRQTWENIREIFREAAAMFLDLQDLEQQEKRKRIQVLSYRKKKSQAKNWSKWKKRR